MFILKPGDVIKLLNAVWTFPRYYPAHYWGDSIATVKILYAPVRELDQRGDESVGFTYIQFEGAVKAGDIRPCEGQGSYLLERYVFERMMRYAMFNKAPKQGKPLYHEGQLLVCKDRNNHDRCAVWVFAVTQSELRPEWLYKVSEFANGGLETWVLESELRSLNREELP